MSRLRARREPWRFASSVLVVTGLLLLLDAGVTLVWQEPISALLATRSRAALEDELGQPPRFARELRLRELRARANGYAERVEVGRAFGRIAMPSLGRDSPVVEGVGDGELRKAPGHYPDTRIPGERGTVAIAGHRTTWGAPFRPVDELTAGDPIVVEMPYARITYRVESTRIVPPSAIWVKRRARHDRLVLTACDPLYSAAQRIVVFARYERAEAAI